MLDVARAGDMVLLPAMNPFIPILSLPEQRRELPVGLASNDPEPVLCGSPEELESLLSGGYLAEVIRRRAGGKWKMESSLYPGQKILTFETCGIDLWPQLKVGKRLENGAEDNVWHYYLSLMDRFQKRV